MTLPDFSPHIVTGRKTSARFVLSVMNASIAIVKPAALSAPSAERVVRAVVLRVRAQEHERVDAALLGGREDPGRVEAPARGHRAPGVAEPLAAGVQRHPTGQEARREAEVQRAADVAAAQRDEELGAGSFASAATARDRRVRRLGEVAATEHDDDVAVAAFEQCRGLGAPRRRSTASPPSASTRRPAVSPCSPGSERIEALA